MEESTRGVKFFTIVVFLCLAFADVSGSSEQPLADIAIHKATRALSEAVSIFASPQLLGLQAKGLPKIKWRLTYRENVRTTSLGWERGAAPPLPILVCLWWKVTCFTKLKAKQGLDFQSSFSMHMSLAYIKGEDTEWVNVTIFNPNATADDWVGVFSPANFNSSTCTPDDGDDTPYICTSPLKPNLVAISNFISFLNPKAPLYPRLAQGKSWNDMTVTWTSGYNIDEAVPFVEWGLQGTPQSRSPAGTLTFTRNTMCGPPARTVGWRDPGFIHTSFLKDLWPNFVYTYRMGHILSNGSYIWSNSYSFKSSPYPGQDSLQRVVVFGDMGKAERDGSNEYSNSQPGALNTTDQLIRDLGNYDIVFHIGDITYANGYISEWDQFTAQVQPIASTVPYMIASGNHERDWTNSGSFYDTTDSGGECGVLAETMFYVPAENRAKFWYSTDYGMFHFCVADSEHDWREGSEQYAFIEQCLASADRQKQPWLIFIAHRVLGYSSASGYASEGTTGEPMGRDSLQKLWQKYKVDLGFYGHKHNYERICPIYENQCVSSETSHYSGTVNGTIHVVAGNGGKKLDTYSQQIPNWSVFRDLDYGFIKLTAFNHSSLLYEYIRSRDGSTQDSFTISRDYRDVLACVHDGCEPTTLAS
ncbi:putative inactive purple acid phosphatase 27 [Morella rubra]|uniref:Purple acid phosphatase n=1 Tax=Morella rubra TaxID=262757 RepID=A0A6A1VWW9_9ROSI|nr:putative inactive purple acid phosphatase 27 [Morella rubra]